MGTAVRCKFWIKTLPAVAFSCLLGQAQAGLFEDDEARRAILELRQTLAELRQKVDSNKAEVDQRTVESQSHLADDNVQLKRSLLDLQNQLEALRADIAKLRGQSEQVARDVADVQRKQKDSLQGLDERVRKLEPVRVSSDGRDFLADPAEKRDFDAAMAVFRKGDFTAAQAAFVDFLNHNAQSGYRPSALFWLGNAQYATKDYKEAITNFRTLVSTAPDHMRAPEALLAIGNCQFEIKDVKGARKTLDELIANYPSSEAAVAAKDRLTRQK